MPKLTLALESLDVESFPTTTTTTEERVPALNAATLDRLCHTRWSCPITW